MFSAMFLVMMGYDDRTVEDNLFTRWFSAGLGLVILSLGEYEVQACSSCEERKDGIIFLMLGRTCISQ